MKKFLFMAMLCTTAIAFTSCFPTGDTDSEDINVTDVSLKKTTLALEVGGGEILEYVITPDDANNQVVTWSSSNDGVATVDEQGLVEGVAKGTATITVTTEDGGKTATCIVTVIDEIIEVTGITLAPTTANVEIGETTALTATVMPENASDKTITWKTSDATVATVTEGVVTGVKEGMAIITATASNGDEATCTVTVKSISKAVKFRLPDFSNTRVYYIKDGDAIVGEVTVEYIPEFSKSQAPTIVYPYGNDGKPDYTKGYVVNNGGSISWSGNAYTYTKGNSQASLVLYINEGTVTTTEVADAKNITPTPDIFKDKDNNEYGIVKIASQYWIQSNLKTKTLPDGSSLESVMSNEPAKWRASEGCYTYYKGENADDYEANYGLLYNYKAAQNIAPEGWRLPSNEDYEALNTYLSATPDGAGIALREKGDAHWTTAATSNSTNVSRFSAFGAGLIANVGEAQTEINYIQLKQLAAWFTSTRTTETNMIIYSISENTTTLDKGQGGNTTGASIRLVRD